MSGSSNSTDTDSPSGLALAVLTYSLWGFLPLYIKLLSHIPAAEVVLHRVIWSIPIAGAVLIATRRTNELRTAIKTPRMVAMAFVTATLISINWGIYIWAISNGNTMDTALGYYINPIFSVFLGFAVLGERLTKLQWAAIALAFSAVMVLTLEQGRLPYTAIALFVSWGFYALCKRSLPIGPNQGFFLEVLILTTPALIYWAYLIRIDQSHFSGNIWLMFGCGVITAIPLIMYANAAKRLRLTTIAILQYIAPTIIFLVAVFLFDEPFGKARAIAFPMIWLALALYSYSLIRGRREK